MQEKTRVTLVKPPAVAAPAIAPVIAPSVPGTLRQGMPLPTGQPMRTSTGAAAPNLAAAQLHPTNVAPTTAAMLTQAVQDINREVAAAANTPPVSPNTPRVVFTTVPIEQLSQADRDKALTGIAEVAQAGKAIAQAQRIGIQKPEITTPLPPPPPEAPPAVDPEWQAAMDAESRRQASGVGGEVAMTPTLDVQLSEPDRRPLNNNVVPDPHFVRPADAPASDVAAETIAHAPGNCPYCAWNMRKEVDPEPSDEEKLVFAKCVLGLKDYTRELTMFDGMLTVRFRALTTSELDKIFQHVLHERRSGKIDSELDFWERINRHKLYLQLIRLRSTGDDGFDFELPAGLTPRTSPRAVDTWDPTGEADAAGNLFDAIEEEIQSKVLVNEVIFRMVYKANLAFNRDLARLEAISQAASFSKATA